MSPYQACRSLYRGLVPRAARQRIDLLLPAPARALRQHLLTVLQRTARHDEIYDAQYYAQDVEPLMARSAETIAQTVVDELRPGRVIDVGCGTGLLLAALRRHGVQGSGFEYARAALEVCWQRGLDVQRLDLEHDPIPADRADVIISTEVAEHLPANCADRFVQILTRMGPWVVLTAAVPGSGGTDHVNEQPNEYWIEKFAQHGFGYERERSLSWRQQWARAGVGHCFASSLMLFRSSVA